MQKLLTKIAMSIIAMSPVAHAVADDFIIIQSTTSTQNSGLYEFLLPLIKQDTGVEIRVVAVGTGQAIKNARNCNGDVLLVHAKSAEEQFVADGFGGPRANLMYNDFVIVGPQPDPAGIAGGRNVVAAFKTIFESKTPFASRGDDSGTHKKEMQLWNQAGLNPLPASGQWYLETGSGMGATLNIAIGKSAYTITDRASWLSFGNKGDFAVMTEGDERLFNQYGIIPVSKEKCPTVKSDLGKKFVDWMLSEKGQNAIARFEVDGQQLFFPNAKRQQN